MHCKWLLPKIKNHCMGSAAKGNNILGNNKKVACQTVRKRLWQK